MQKVEPDFVVYINSLKSLPEAQKAKIREKLLVDAGITRKPTPVPAAASEALGKE